MVVRGSRRRAQLSVLVLAVVLLTAGCVALPTDDSAGPELADRLAEADPPSEITATVEIRETVDGETATHTEDVWLRDDGASRIEGGDGSGADGYDHVVVTDGQQRWHHDATAGESQHIELDSDAPSFLEGLYAQQDRYFADYEVTAVEETTVEDRETYRVAFDPPANETVERSVGLLVGDTEYVLPLERGETDHDAHRDRTAERVTVWFDRETLFPVKHAIEGDGIELATTYQDLEIEPGIDDERFEFQPPDESTETDAPEFVLPTTETYETIDEAEDAAPFAVAEPDPETLPADVDRANITGYEFPDEDRTQVSITYRSDDETVSVTTSDGERLFATGGESIEIGGGSGTIATTAQGVELQWSCADDDRYYSIFVSDAFDDASETAIAIAESIETGCS